MRETIHERHNTDHFATKRASIYKFKSICCTQLSTEEMLWCCFLAVKLVPVVTNVAGLLEKGQNVQVGSEALLTVCPCIPGERPLLTINRFMDF